MAYPFDYWELLAGIALFLFAMAQLETGLQALGGRPLALYLKERADRRVNAVLGGIVGTAILQSSSVVGLMVLAFTGAGLLNLTSALGIVFGSNLGTTLTGWIVATLGFKFEIFNLALPCIGLGGLAYLFGRGRTVDYGRIALSVGLLLLGLQMMKESVESVQQLIDIQDLAGLAPWQYLLFGIVVAAVIQSSSATMIITLAALNAGIISLPNAAAVAIGADLGTTTTVILGALRGSHTKQQVAAGHVIFNVVTDLIAFILRLPLLGVVAMLGIEDPLYALVAFHSLFNLLGLLIFIPVTAPFARWLEQLFPERETQEARYLSEVSHGAGSASLQAVECETQLLIARAVRLIMAGFSPPLTEPPGRSPVQHRRGIEQHVQKPFDNQYHAAKTLEGELVEFTIRLQAEELDADDSARLSRLLSAAREAMHCAKAIKNINHNLVEMAGAESALPSGYTDRFRNETQQFVTDIYQLRAANAETIAFEDLAAALQAAHRRHDAAHDDVYAGVRDNRIDESKVSSLLNVIRELLRANESLVFALGDYYLDPAEADDLERLPV